MVEKVKKAKRKLNTLVGFACVHATFNNTIVLSLRFAFFTFSTIN